MGKKQEHTVTDKQGAHHMLYHRAFAWSVEAYKDKLTLAEALTIVSQGMTDGYAVSDRVMRECEALKRKQR